MRRSLWQLCLIGVVGCSGSRGAVPLAMERGDEAPRLPNFTREMQEARDRTQVRVEGFTQVSAEARR